MLFWTQGSNIHGGFHTLSVSGVPSLHKSFLEAALVSHRAVAEAVAIGKPDQLKGEHVKVFVILKQGFTPSEELERDLKMHMRTTVGALAVPEELEFVSALPKTRSGKIMRRVMRAIELNESLGDTSTLDT